MVTRIFVTVLLSLLLCAWGVTTSLAQDAADSRESYFYGIAGDDVIGMGVGHSVLDTYVGLEWFAKDTVQQGACDKSEQSITIALTPGITTTTDNTRYTVNAILGYYEADYIDACAYPAESSDSGFDYGLGVSMSFGSGYILGLRYTDSSEAGIIFGISW